MDVRARIKKTIPRKVILFIRRQEELLKWRCAGKPVPLPERIKYQAILDIAKRNGIRMLVETGTSNGSLIEFSRKHFKKIYSIELGDELFLKAQKKFSGYDHIHLVHGDSGKELFTIAKNISEPAVFWLDAHYDGGSIRGELDTPILQEMRAVFERHNARDAILIDDARFFDGTNDYPTLKQVEDMVAEQVFFVFSVDRDIIMILPK